MEQRKRILIVDDEPEFIEVLQHLLEDEGYEVTYACDGREGLKKADVVQPDLIILDMMMPSVSGIDFYHAIYDHEMECSRYPVFVLTGKHQMEKIFSGLKVEGFFLKPFVPDELLSAVYKVTHEKDYSRERSQALESKHVLIVEEDRERAREIALGFVDANFTVEIASNADEALEKACNRVPCLILIQYDLSTMRGDRLAEKIKQDPTFLNTAIIPYCDTHSRRSDPEFDSDRFRELKISNPIHTLNPKTLLKASEAVIDRMRAA